MEMLQGKGSEAQSQGASAASVGEDAQKAKMDDVLQGVEALLGRLSITEQGRSVGASAGPMSGETDMGLGEDVIEMDSVKRKRKKKISKHKYKKRRKATRAQRKRLGK
jgi:hypothetical protein